jgi:ABC-type nickel/cobalt efflux system permease component RcnA
MVVAVCRFRCRLNAAWRNFARPTVADPPAAVDVIGRHDGTDRCNRHTSMVDGSLISALGVGFLLGLRHALDADHVAAVSTFVSRYRGLYGSCVLGGFWGIGHTGALLLAALATTLFRLRIPPQVDKTLEAFVSILVVALGADVLRQALGSVRVHRHEHAHSGGSHRHLHVHLGFTASHTHVHIDGKRPLLRGALHGLAGSAALLLVVLTTLPSTLAALLYVTVFGVGSTVGMVIVSGLVGIPFAVGGSSERARIALQFAVGIASLGVGVAMLRPLAAR